jgi:hypothetical protein
MLSQVTITDGPTGETVRQFPIKADPVDICVSSRKDDSTGRTGIEVSMY